MAKPLINETFTDGYIYEPKEKISNLSEVYDTDRYYQMIDRIESSNADKETKEFLKLAATRLIRYNFKKIADYYCVVSPDIQKLFEKAKLVIIDDDHKLENAIKKLNSKIEQYRKEDGNRQEIHS